MCLMLYDDIWMETTYVIFCVAWMQIMDSHIPLMKQRIQVELDVDHSVSTTPQQYTPIFANGIHYVRGVHTIQISSSDDRFINDVNPFFMFMM